MSELLPEPHSPLTATVSGGRVFSLRRNRDSPTAMPVSPSTSASPGSSGFSDESPPSTLPFFASLPPSCTFGGGKRAGKAHNTPARSTAPYHFGGHIQRLRAAAAIRALAGKATW